MRARAGVGLATAVLAVALAAGCAVKAPSLPQPAATGSLLLPAPVLQATRDSLRAAAPRQQAAFQALLDQADEALAMPPVSVLDKDMTAASGDRHDYLSFGPYWWPDPAKPDGLPYVRRDGERNPGAARGSDSAALARLAQAVHTLGLAHALTGEARYAAKAAALARVWFLDPATRMNPNFQHAQAIPGITVGRGIGLIEARWLIHVNEGLALVAASPAWTAQDQRAMRAWLERFYGWLTESQHGRDEQAEHNNHGSWYDAQVAHLALVLGRTDEARAVLREGMARRLAVHVAPDGSQPHEMARTRSLDYAVFNLEALLLCARLAAPLGVDWWQQGASDGRSLGNALAFLAPFADPARPWLRQDLSSGDRHRLLALLQQALHLREDKALRQAVTQAMARLPPGPVDLLYPLRPAPAARN